jgi:hypothetical protein
MILLNNTVDVVYSGIESGPLLRGRSFKHGGIANNTRAWSAGGTVTHETSEVPSGKTYSHKLTFVDGGYSNVMEWEITRVESLSLFISAWAKHDILGLTEQERLHFQIIDPHSDPLINASASPLVEWIAADSTDWQSWQLDYNRPDDRPLLFRICAKRSSGNAYAYFDPIGIPDIHVDILALQEMLTDIRETEIQEVKNDFASLVALTTGMGPEEQVYTVLNGTTGQPEAGVTVIMSTDLNMANIIHKGITDALGKVYFWPDVPVGTTVYLWRFKTGVDFLNPDIEVTA